MVNVVTIVVSHGSISASTSKVSDESVVGKSIDTGMRSFSPGLIVTGTASVTTAPADRERTARTVAGFAE